MKINCSVVAETPKDAAHFFGFHDVTPWDRRNEKLALLRVDPTLRRLPDGENAEVCLWHPEEGTIEPVGTTTAWNFQMGARVQWLPDGRLIFNVVQKGKPSAIILDPSTRHQEKIDFWISAIHPNGREALAPNFGRLSRHWPAYGVNGANPPDIDTPAPHTDGLWRVDLQSGKPELLISLDNISTAGSKVPAESMQFVTHPSYNPSGTRFVFHHRFFISDGALFSRLLSASRDGTDLNVLAEEKVSHFDWIDDDKLVVWTRFISGGLSLARKRNFTGLPILRSLIRYARRLSPAMKQGLTGEGYFEISVDGSNLQRPIGKGILDQDGHPMFSGDRRWMLTDTYPDKDGCQALILFEMETSQRIDIGSFPFDPAVGTRDLKTDLHPRWDLDFRRICIDTSSAGIRQCMIVDASPALEKLEAF